MLAVMGDRGILRSRDADEMDRQAVASAVAEEQYEQQETAANFSNLSEDMQELIVDKVMPELAALKKVIAAGHDLAALDEGAAKDDVTDDVDHEPAFLDQDFVEVREQEHVSTGNHILLVLVLLVTCMLASHIVARLIENSPRAARYMRYLNSSTISVFVGWIFGVGMGFSSSDTIRATRKFSSELLYYMLLPPIILEAGCVRACVFVRADLRCMVRCVGVWLLHIWGSAWQQTWMFSSCGLVASAEEDDVLLVVMMLLGVYARTFVSRPPDTRCAGEGFFPT